MGFNCTILKDIAACPSSGPSIGATATTKKKATVIDTFPLLRKTDFPRLKRTPLTILQANLGYYCNQTCLHCHVNASPRRKEQMDRKNADLLLRFLDLHPSIETLDLTGGAPELQPQFRYLVKAAAERGTKLIDRCNLTVLELEGQEELAEYLTDYKIEIIASLPCYTQDNVDQQRGDGVFESSIRGLQRLNGLGYGQPGSGLILRLVYNPLGPSLPPPQEQLEEDYRVYLQEHFGILFTNLLALTNMPINRFGSTLVSNGQFRTYMDLLKSSSKIENRASVMCRNTLSVDYDGYTFDCDFNQMLKMPLGNKRRHLSDLLDIDFAGMEIAVADHCYGCTAGQGSSCGGALN